MDEFPIASIPSIRHWSENFAFAGFDARSGIAIFFHIGRWRRDLRLWREVITIALPDGSVLVHRAIANARTTDRGPGGANFQIDCSNADKASMRLLFLGGVRRVDEGVLYEQPLCEGPYHRLAFDLAYEGVAPKWNLSKVNDKNAFIGTGHVEQIGRLTGTIEINDERLLFNSLINRDHSRGPRVFDSNLRHIWQHGHLDDGLMFQLYEAEVVGQVGPAFSEVNVIENGQSYDGKMTIHYKLPFIDNRHRVKERVSMTISYAGKTINITTVQFVRTIALQSTSPNDFYVGRRQEDDIQNTTVLEQGVLYATSDGRRGYGHMERLVPGKLLADPS